MQQKLLILKLLIAFCQQQSKLLATYEFKASSFHFDTCECEHLLENYFHYTELLHGVSDITLMQTLHSKSSTNGEHFR